MDERTRGALIWSDTLARIDRERSTAPLFLAVARSPQLLVVGTALMADHWSQDRDALISFVDVPSELESEMKAADIRGLRNRREPPAVGEFG